MSLTNNKTYLAKVCLLIALCLMLLLYHRHILNANNERIQLREYANEIGIQIKDSLQREIRNTQRIVDSVAKALIANGRIDSTQTKKMVQTILEKCVHLDGAFITFLRKGQIISYGSTISPYISRIGGRFIQHNLSRVYILPWHTSRSPWCHIPQSEFKPLWIAPYFSIAANRRTASYLVPILLPNGIYGLVGADYSTMEIYKLLNGWKSGRIGYPYLMTRKGEFIAHPNNDTRTLAEIGNAFSESTLIGLANAIKNGDTINPSKFYHRNTVSKAMCWEKIIRIKSVDWYLGISVTDQQVYSSPSFFNQQRKRQIQYSFYCFGGLLLIEFFLLLLFFRKKQFLSILSWAIALFLITEIILLYHICLKYPSVAFSDMEITNSVYQKSKLIEEGQNSNMDTQKLSRRFDRWNFAMLLDDDGTNDYIRLYLNSFKNKAATPTLLVPTGLCLQTVKFSDAYTTKISGYIWQTYPYPSKIKAGIVFPDAETSSIEMKDSSMIFKPNGQKATFYRWRFTVEIREPFDYSHFPFDYNDLWLRIWNIDFSKNVVLVPDFSSYILLHPSFKPGLDNDITIPGWNIEGSYFSFKEKSYNTNFDPNHNLPKDAFPELHYNIILKRDYWDSIITRIIPIAVLLFMTYSILYIAKRKDALDVAIACSGLLFVAVFEHVNLRRNLDTSGIIYMEHYYFTTYLLLMLVSVNTILNEHLSKMLPDYLNFTQLTKIMYWPLALLVILIVTIITFY